MKKKIIISVICGLTIFGCTGCSGRSMYTEYREIDEIEPIQAIGLDFAEGIITASLSSGASMNGTPPIRMVSSANTVRRALADMQQFTAKKYIMLSHVKYYLLGEDAARSGMRRYVDYVERAMEVKQNTAMYIVKGSTAAELVINAGNESTSIVELLKALTDDSEQSSGCGSCSIMDVSEDLVQNGCALVGAVQLVDEFDIISGASKSTVANAGYAVIKGETLISFIDKESAKGVNIITNRTAMDVLEMDDTQGKMGAFRLVSAKSDIKAQFSGNDIKGITIDVKVGADVEELENEINLYDTNVITQLEDNLALLIFQRVEEAIEGAQLLKADYMSIGEKIEMVHPVKFSKIKDRWHEIFSELDITINVKANIERTYDIGDPMPRNH